MDILKIMISLIFCIIGISFSFIGLLGLIEDIKQKHNEAYLWAFYIASGLIMLFIGLYLFAGIEITIN